MGRGVHIKPKKRTLLKIFKHNLLIGTIKENSIKNCWCRQHWKIYRWEILVREMFRNEFNIWLTIIYLYFKHLIVRDIWIKQTRNEKNLS